MDMYEMVRWGEDLEREFAGASDRAAAIVGAAMLDAQLKMVLQATMPRWSNLKEIFEGPSAPLSSFSAKIELAFSLGLLSERERRNLVLIRRVRNDFAHRLGDISFTTDLIRSRCAELEVPLVMRMPDEIPSVLIVDESSDVSTLLPKTLGAALSRWLRSLDGA